MVKILLTVLLLLELLLPKLQLTKFMPEPFLLLLQKLLTFPDFTSARGMKAPLEVARSSPLPEDLIFFQKLRDLYLGQRT